MTTLELTDVSLSYPDGDSRVTALDHVSMTATAGRMTAIVGESGSGKSSLLSVAAGLISPTTGEARVEGEVVTDDVRRNKIGMIFQQANLLASLTVRDQLLVTDHIRGLRGRALRDRATRADALLDRVGLTGLGGRRMGQLSGGQRQRVTIARALMGQPVLLLADEPTAALDTRLSRDIVSLLRDLTDDTGVATVMVTHDRSLLDAFDDVVTVADGRVAVEVA